MTVASPSAARSRETYSCTMWRALTGARSSHTESISASIDTTSPTRRSRTASSARSPRLGSSTTRPSTSASSRPRIRKLTCVIARSRIPQPPPEAKQSSIECGWSAGGAASGHHPTDAHAPPRREHHPRGNCTRCGFGGRDFRARERERRGEHIACRLLRSRHAHLRTRTALRPPASHGYASRCARGGKRHPRLDRPPAGPSRRHTCPTQAPTDQQTMDCVPAPTRSEFCASLGSDLRRHRRRNSAGADGRSPTPPPRAGTRIRPATARGRTPRAQAPRARLHRRRSRAISDGAIALVD